MNKRKSVGLLLAAGIACIGCCAVPLYLIIAGTSSASMMVVGGSKSVELLLCVLPVAFLGIIYMITRRKKQCCPEPADKCSNNQCSTSSIKNTE